MGVSFEQLRITNYDNATINTCISTIHANKIIHGKKC